MYMKVAIEGMHCQACVRRVQNAIVSVEGTRVQDVEIGSAVVVVDPKREEAVLEAVRKAGYEARKTE
jgi:copper chaperone CopZ